MGRGRQAIWVMAEIFQSNLHRHLMNKCWKFQEDILILVWFRAERLKICRDQWTPVVHYHQKWTTGVHLLQQIFSLSALNQTRIKISFWNFQHLFITSLCKFEIKILAITQIACQTQPISAKTLDASSDRICWDISKRKKLVRFWTYMSHLMEGISNILKKMAFWNFSNKCSVQVLQDVHALLN